MNDHPPPVYILAAWEKRIADADITKLSMAGYGIASQALRDAIKDATRDFAEVRGK